jgi:hypothetical protein
MLASEKIEHTSPPYRRLEAMNNGKIELREHRMLESYTPIYITKSKMKKEKKKEKKRKRVSAPN